MCWELSTKSKMTALSSGSGMNAQANSEMSHSPPKLLTCTLATTGKTTDWFLPTPAPTAKAKMASTSARMIKCSLQAASHGLWTMIPRLWAGPPSISSEKTVKIKTTAPTKSGESNTAKIQTLSPTMMELKTFSQSTELILII